MLIGFSGYSGSGKDTAAAFLVDVYGFERRAFADALKKRALENNPVVDTPGWVRDRVPLSALVDEFGWEHAKREFPAVREYLQRVGVEKRNQDEDYWVDQVLPKPWAPMADSIRHLNDIVITDVRFPNEARRIKALGGTLVRITRPGVGPVNGHVSETAVEGMHDSEVLNDGDLEDLHDQLDHIMSPYAYEE